MDSSTETPEEVAAAKRKEEGFACPNPKCMCKECTCGEACTCNISKEVTCDPCAEFKKKKQAEKEAAPQPS